MQAADAIVIGGGFYGASIAAYLAKTRGLKQVLLVERSSKLLQRASKNNQARVHNGYHYPRSYSTAFRSRVNLPRFLKTWPDVVKKDFSKLYAIARNDSKVTAKQFERFCHEIGASVSPVEAEISQLFEPRLIEAVFHVEEYAFDYERLADWAFKELNEAGVTIQFRTSAEDISYSYANRSLKVVLKNGSGEYAATDSNYVFNCTYSGLNQFSGGFRGVESQLKHELTEMALIKTPEILSGLGITVMDGPFFSLMPFPARGLQTLSHVRYTPHFSWRDRPNLDPYHLCDEYSHHTRFDRMIRDAARYVPSIINSEYVESLFEMKTVLIKNEGDDGRPILFEKHPDMPGCYSILGGKIDNIFDAIEKLDTEDIQCRMNA